MGLLKTAGRAAVASSVHGRVQRRQQQRWAAQEAQPVAQPVQAAPVPVQVVAAPVAAPASVSTDEMLAQLTQLGALRDAGVLTDAEFEMKKAKILSAG